MSRIDLICNPLKSTHQFYIEFQIEQKFNENIADRLMFNTFDKLWSTLVLLAILLNVNKLERKVKTLGKRIFMWVIEEFRREWIFTWLDIITWLQRLIEIRKFVSGNSSTSVYSDNWTLIWVTKHFLLKLN